MIRISPVLRTAALLLGLGILAACSSAPPPPDRINDRKNRAVDFTVAGNKYYNEANFDQALLFFQMALEANVAVDNEEGASLSYNSIGKTLFAQGKMAEADASYNEAAKIARKLKNSTLIYQSVNNQGEILLQKNKNADAVKLFTDTLATVAQTDAQKEVAILYHGLGVARRNLALEAKPQDESLLKQALAGFQQALSLNTGLNLKQEMASNWYMTARVHMDLKNWPAAAAAAASALDYDRQMENSLGIGLDLRLLARINLSLDKKDDAWDQLLRAWKVFTAISQKEQQLRTLELIVPLAKDLKKSDELAYYSQLLDRANGKN